MTRLRLRAALLAATILVTPVGLTLAAAAPANAQIAITAGVNNRFERDCRFGCSLADYKQVNGDFNSSMGSTCVSRHWTGSTEDSRPKGVRCTTAP
jgi:hypothetical protein